MSKLPRSSRKKTLFRVLFFSCLLAVTVRGLHQRLGEKANTVRAEDLDFTIVENSSARGLEFTNTTVELPDWISIKPWVQAIGASVAVVDVNQDGFMDIYVTNSRIGSKNALFVNDGAGHFTEQAAAYGLDHINDGVFSGRSIFFDCNGDGRRELLQVTNACPQIYSQDGTGRFKQLDSKFPDSACSINNAVAAVDLNGDGILDLILGGYPPSGPGQLRVLPTSAVNGTNGAPLHVLLGDGQCHFKKADGILNPGGNFFFNSVGVGDLRSTGHADVWLATDYTSDKIFLRKEKGYELSAAPYSNATSGMNSEVLYLDGDKPPYVFVSQVFQQGYIVGGNNLWQFDGSEFRDQAISRGLHQCGWSWAGRGIDLNNDGRLDLAVTNGFISGDRSKDKDGKRSGDPKTYWYAFSVLLNSADFLLQNYIFWPDMKGKSLAGFEQDCLYVNRGDHFDNVAEAVGFDSERYDGRAVAVIDPDNSGRQHLIVANQNGPLRYYTVTPKEQNAWVGFTLEGKGQNREAIGAKVTLIVDGRPYVRENYTTNSFASQSDPRLHFGLGHVNKIDEVSVRWPGGQTQKFKGLSLNRYQTLKEE